MKGKTNNWKKKMIAILVTVTLITCGCGAVFAFGEGISEALQSIGSSIRQAAGLAETEQQEMSQTELKQAAQLEQKAQTVEVSSTVRQKLQSRPNKKLEGAYRKLMAEKNVPETQQKKLEDYLLAYDDPQVVLMLYDYLHDNYFTFSDLDAALARYGQGENIDAILQTYADTVDRFVARDYEHEEIESLVSNPLLTYDDIAIAEILDFRQVAEFYDIIGARIDSKAWEQIAQDYGLLNGTGKQDRITITAEEVEYCQAELGISQQEAIKMVSTLRLAEIKDNPAQYLKSGKTVGQALRQRAQKKMER